MRTASDIRRENLRYLRDTRFQGNNGRMASFVGVAQMQIARIFHEKSSRRNVGDKLARTIEAALELEKGWLDQDHAKTDDLMRMVDGLDTEGKAAVKAMVAALVRQQQQT